MEKIPVRKDEKSLPENTEANTSRLTGPGLDASTPASPVGIKKLSASLIVLQWLTYTFWGWLLISLTILTSMVATHYIEGVRSSEDAIPFAVAGAIVLTPVALLCDRAYKKREAIKKTSVEMIIMIIYAVIFTLASIGALILTVFYTVNITFDVVDDTPSKLVAITTAGVATLLFGAVSMRVLRPAKLTKLPIVFSISAVSVAALLLVLTFAGPIAKLASLKDDRLIEANLPDVHSAISRYAQSNGELPESLEQPNYSSEGTKSLVAAGMVEYLPAEGTYRYQLCVEYQEELQPGWTGDVMIEEEYTSYVDTSYHEAGKVCYKLEALAQEIDDKSQAEGRPDTDDSQSAREQPAGESQPGSSRPNANPDAPTQSDRSSSSRDGNTRGGGDGLAGQSDSRNSNWSGGRNARPASPGSGDS